jgi:hypothetical protein
MKSDPFRPVGTKKIMKSGILKWNGMNGKSEIMKREKQEKEFAGWEQKFCTCHSALPCISNLSGECMKITQHPYIHSCFMGGHYTAYIYVSRGAAGSCKCANYA